jgi:hypothetical protein
MAKQNTIAKELQDLENCLRMSEGSGYIFLSREMLKRGFILRVKPQTATELRVYSDHLLKKAEELVERIEDLEHGLEQERQKNTEK